MIIIFLYLQVAIAFYLIYANKKQLKLQAEQQELYTKQQCEATREFFADDLKNTIGVTHNIATRVATSKAKAAAEEALKNWMLDNQDAIRKLLADRGGK